MFRLSLALLLIATLTRSAAAADPSLETLELGPPVLGPKWDKADLKGRVVLIEKWGVH